MNLMDLADDMKVAMRRERGWEYPPDAGDSTLGAWGIQNATVLWLLRLAPELLEWTPKELTEGIKNSPKCPRCGGHMALKVADASGRQPRRFVWACHRPIAGGRRGFYDCGGRRAFNLHKPTIVARDDDATPMGLQRLIRWTQEGATVEYQPDKYGQKRAVKIESKDRESRRGRRPVEGNDGHGAGRHPKASAGNAKARRKAAADHGPGPSVG